MAPVFKTLELHMLASSELVVTALEDLPISSILEATIGMQTLPILWGMEVTDVTNRM